MTPRTKGKAPRSPSSSAAGEASGSAVGAESTAVRTCPEGQPQTLRPQEAVQASLPRLPG